MASIQFNISKGREVELYNRVDSNDPTNSALIMLVLETGSLDGINGLVDFDTVSAITAGGVQRGRQHRLFTQNADGRGPVGVDAG